ncbi:hypothetical protein HOP50_17g80380 [Chloropicon primus]|uniref:Uncharacterized protein n=2 Tax=Chloropicon primus TaxID=1764295 RepID=A0A5B8MZK4_9CHLO|nr:hypothetical protein A3770_17p80140 [Chloropicon primus]UPR04693.1 hypothetical protein HOP50_17g80380 [Chloropicon primus]|eukprot:QDZ25496.1 hypothetical protein A3770_17p80140 [Chloropicon primus]
MTAEVVDLEELLDTSDLPEHPGVLRAIDLVTQVRTLDLHKHVNELKGQAKTWQQEIELSDEFLRDLVMLQEEAKTLHPLKESLLQRLANVLHKSRQHKKRQLDREIEEEFELESELLARKQEKIDEMEHENNESHRVDLEKKRTRNIFEIEQARVEKEVQALEREFTFEVETYGMKIKKEKNRRDAEVEAMVAEDTQALGLLAEENARKLANKVEEQERETFERDDNHRKEREYHQEQLQDANKASNGAKEVLAELVMRHEAATEDLATNRDMLAAKSERLVEAEQQASKAEDDVNNFRTERQKTFEESVRWSREQYETWIQAIGTRRLEVDSQLKTSLEQLLEKRVEAIRPLDAKVQSVTDDKVKFEEEDQADGERLDRLRSQAEVEMQQYDALEKQREKLLEDAEQKRYLAVKTAHLKEESKLSELKDELERKKARRDNDLSNIAEETTKLLALVMEQRQTMRKEAESHWKEAQDEVDKENEDLRGAIKEANETISHCEREGERYLREQEEDLVPLRNAIEEAVESEKMAKEAHDKAMEEAKEGKQKTQDERQGKVDDLASFEKASEEENLARSKDIDDSQEKIEKLIKEKHAAVDSKYGVMRGEMASLEKEEMNNISIEKHACELTLKDLEQFHAHEANRIDDLMTVVEDFEGLVSQCQKSSENERDSIEKEWELALLTNKREQQSLEEKMRMKEEGLKKAEDAARKALDQELGRLNQTVSHAKAEQQSKYQLVQREIAMRKKEVQEIDHEMKEIMEKERLAGERKATSLSDQQIKFLRPRTTDQIMSPRKAPPGAQPEDESAGTVPASEVTGNHGPVNAEHHAAADLCEQLKEFYKSGAKSLPLTTIAEEGPRGEVDEEAVVAEGSQEGTMPESTPGKEEGPVADEEDPLSFTREIERLSEEDPVLREIDIIAEAPPSLNDCLNQGGRYSELSRRKLRLLVEIKAKEEECLLDEEHVNRVERRIDRQKRLRISALNEMLGIQMEELEDEKETKLKMVAQRRERLHASRKAYITKHAKCHDMLHDLSEACLPSLTHLREYSNEQSSGWSSAEKEALADLRRVQILEKETEEHFAQKKDQLQVSEREDHEQCERDMVDAREHLARKRVDLVAFNQKMVEERERREQHIESLAESIGEQDHVMSQMEDQRKVDEQASVDLLESLHSKINNVYNIRKDAMRENAELKEKTEQKLPFFHNNLAANEERILSEQAEYERKMKAAEVHREGDLKEMEVKKEDVEQKWQEYSVDFEKQCSLAREQAKSAIASAQMDHEADCTSEEVKGLKRDAEEAFKMSEQHRADAAKAQQTREHRRVLQHERWRRFLEACEQEKVDLHAELDSEEKQLKLEYDGYFADLEEEEVAAHAELEANEQKAKDENQVRYRQERDLEVLVEKLNESARESKNSKHQQERVITEKEKVLENAKKQRETAEAKNADCDLNQKRCVNLLERLTQRIAKEVQEHTEVLVKERADYESQLNLALESSKLAADEKLQRMQVENEKLAEREQKEFDDFVEKQKAQLEENKLELQDEVRIARETLERDLLGVDKVSRQRGRDRIMEAEFDLKKRKLERESKQRKFNEIELKYDAFVDNQLADIEAYFDLLGERLHSHGRNVYKQRQLERQRAESKLKKKMEAQLEDNQRRVQIELEANRRKMHEETQQLIKDAEEEMWARLQEERAARLALIDQKRSEMKRELEEKYISSQVRIREELAEAEKSKIDNVLSIFGADSTKRGEIALKMKLEKERPSSRDEGKKVMTEKEEYEKERKELIKEMALMDLELQELEYE